MPKLYIEIDTDYESDWLMFKKRQPNGIVLSSADAIEVTQKLLDDDEMFMISAMNHDPVEGVMFDIVPLQTAVDRALERANLASDTELPIIISAAHCTEDERGN